MAWSGERRRHAEVARTRHTQPGDMREDWEKKRFPCKFKIGDRVKASPFGRFYGVVAGIDRSPGKFHNSILVRSSGGKQGVRDEWWPEDYLQKR